MEGTARAQEQGVGSRSTFPEPITQQRLRRARALRRLAVAALAIFVVAGAGGLLGVRTATVTAEAEGYAIEVRYAAVARPGLAAPWEVTVSRTGGFAGPVRLATTAAYFDAFDENGLDPEPQAATTMGDLLVWEVAPPEGEELVVSFDARIEPARQSGADARTVLLDGTREIVSVRYSTWVMP